MLTSEALLADPIGRYPAATVACFDPTCGELPRRRLDEHVTVDYLERLARRRAAMLIAASTGHGHLRTVDELETWFRTAASAQLGSAAKMALLRPEDGRAANQRLLGVLHECSYPVVFVRPGTDLPSGAADQQVAANMTPLLADAAQLGMAVGVYSIPDVSGVRLTPEAAERLLDGAGGDHIVAAKVTEANYEQSTRRFLQAPRLKHLKIVQGWDTHLAAALQDGPRFDQQGRQRCGVTSGPMSLAVFQYLHILLAAAGADWDEVTEAQDAITLLFRSMQDDPHKFADLQRAKYIMGLGHPLTGEVTNDQVRCVLAALDTLPRPADRARIARSLDLLGSGPFHEELAARYATS